MNMRLYGAWLVILLLPQTARAQHACQFYAQNPATVTVDRSAGVQEREVEIVFTNTGTSTWQNTGGVVNLSYIELRGVDAAGNVQNSSLYHSSWINRQRVGSFLAIQNGVAPGQRARFVFKVNIDPQSLGVGTHTCYFRPYHAQGGYINNWGQTRITVQVVDNSGPPPAPPPPSPSPPPPPAPSPSPTPLKAVISSVTVERTEIYPGTGTGAQVRNANWLNDRFIIRRYQVLQLRGSVQGSGVKSFEWSVSANGQTRMLGTSADLNTRPDDLFVGQQQLRLRVQDLQDRWSDYEAVSLEVEPWPQVFLPIHGQWTRNGYNYNEGDHIGERSVGAQDWNAPVPGSTDFGLELVASIPGTVTTGAYSDGGNYVLIDWSDPASGVQYQAHYMHLSTVAVRTGQTVVAGQPIGLCGNTGSASQGSHLHYVFRRKTNGVFKAVIPEPCWLDPQTVRQTISHNETVRGNHRVLPASLLILPEQVVTAPYSDWEGWGHQKHWAPTTNQSQPSAFALWDVSIPQSGVWKLWMHNPSGFTNNNAGAPTHNTTSRAVFEINRSRMPGVETYTVDQNGAGRGRLVEVAEFHAQQGDLVQIRQHNATGESDKQMSFDEMVLTLEVPDGSGGGSNPPPAAPPPSSAPQPPTPQPSTPTSTHTSGSTSPSTVSSSGGGCSLSPGSNLGSFPALVLCFLLMLLLSARR